VRRPRHSAGPAREGIGADCVRCTGQCPVWEWKTADGELRRDASTDAGAEARGASPAGRDDPDCQEAGRRGARQDADAGRWIQSLREQRRQPQALVGREPTCRRSSGREASRGSSTQGIRHPPPAAGPGGRQGASQALRLTAGAPAVSRLLPCPSRSARMPSGCGWTRSSPPRPRRRARAVHG
jgi:hypothetical protein